MPINYWDHLEHDCAYHIYNRSIGSDVLFQDEADYRFFLIKYKECFDPYFSTYAFCLIPNHFHFIVKVKSEAEVESPIALETSAAAEKYMEREIDFNAFLVDQMRRFFSSVAKKYNSKYRRKGSLFQEKTKRVNIKNDDRLRYLIAYVHHNPIHHNMRDGFNDWRYSSFSGILSDKPSLLPRSEVMELFGDREGFLDFHDSFRMMKFEEEIE